MNSNLFIPNRIRVGFQTRNDTYTKKLAYIIYYDEKGKLRKEPSWNNWRDKKIDPEEFDNVPTEGFVLNKKVGGYAGDWGNFRQAYVRVYDPRGFEFEISVPNLLYILEHTSSIKGKGLEGEFVYGWEGTDLVLMPTCSPDYTRLAELNQKRMERNTVKVKDLKIGAEYLNKNGEHWIYMGRFDAYKHMYHFDGKVFETYRKLDQYYRMSFQNTRSNVSNKLHYEYKPGNAGKHFFFWNGSGFIYTKSLSGCLIDTINEIPASNYAELFEKLENNPSYSPIDKTKDKITRCTPEEVERLIARNDHYGSWYLSMINNQLAKIRVQSSWVPEYKGKYTVLAYIDDKLVSLLDLFEHQTKITYAGSYRVEGEQVMIPLPFQEIIAILPPYCIEEYLQNGKFYRKVFS